MYSRRQVSCIVIWEWCISNRNKLWKCSVHHHHHQWYPKIFVWGGGFLPVYTRTKACLSWYLYVKACLFGCESLLTCHEEEGKDCIHCVFTCDQTWVHHYTTESKQVSAKWQRKLCQSRPKYDCHWKDACHFMILPITIKTSMINVSHNFFPILH